MAKKDYRSEIGKVQRRNFTLQREGLNLSEEKRTIDLAFASDTPVEHWFGTVILDHSPSAVMLDRLISSGPLLDNHDSDEQIGTVRQAGTDGHVSRATVQFSKRASAEEVFQDVKDDIIRSVSVGFMIHEMVMEERTEDQVTYRATKWEPFEISLVSIPADVTVGVGRAMDDAEDTTDGGADEAEECDCEDKENCDCEENARSKRSLPKPILTVRTAMPKKDDENVDAPQVSEALTRANEITALGEMLGEVELARDMIADEKTPTEFRAAVKAKRKAAQPETPVEAPDAVATRSGGQQFARVQSRVNLKSFKGERALETAVRFGHFLNAALFSADQSREFCKSHGIVIKRAHSESDNESGGFLVPTEFENVMIDLRLEYGIFRRNANVVPMTGSRKERPRRTGGLTAYPIGARGSNRRLTESKKGWDRVALDAKKWGVLAKYEEELSDDSVIAMADDLASEIAFAFTIVEDECGFLGDGSSDYHGIVGLITKLLGLSNTVGNIAGLQVASGNAWSEIILQDILGMVGRLPSFARKTGQVKWYCSNEFWATVLCRIALALGGNALGQIQNEIAPVFLGKPVEIVEVMPHTEANSQVALLYGNLTQAAMFGDRKGMTVKMTDSNDTDFEEDLMAIKGTERFDINVHDVGNAASSAAARKPGPVVALITAAS
jgi:HK97 family phage major capsid protein/HK97 family phage prohead protease